jgi:hypothetical protein
MGTIRLVVVGDIQAVGKTVLEELGFEKNEALYRLAISSFRRRVLPALESTFAQDIARLAARRGLAVVADVRGFKLRRGADGQLTEIRSVAEGPGAERIRLQMLEQQWNEMLASAFRSFVEDNVTWMLSAVQSRPSGQNWIV